MSRSPSPTPEWGVRAWARVGDDVDARHKARFGHAFRRIGRYVKLAQLGAAACFEQVDRAGLDPRRVGIFLGSGLGNTLDTIPLAEGILDPVRPWTSPIAFAGCVGNAAAFYVARALELDGPNVTVSQEELSFEGALLEATLALAARTVDLALVGGVDVITGGGPAHLPRIRAEGVVGEPVETSGWVLLGAPEGAPARLVEVWSGIGEPLHETTARVLFGWRSEHPDRDTRLSPTTAAVRLVEALEEGVPGELVHVQRAAGGLGARVRLRIG